MYLFDFELIIDMIDEELGLFILFNIIFKLVANPRDARECYQFLKLKIDKNYIHNKGT